MHQEPAADTPEKQGKDPRDHPRPTWLGLSADDRRACHDAIRLGSKSFYAASMLLPAKQRFAARALYAFCRNSDDLVDDSADNQQAAFRLRQRLDAVYHGPPYDLAKALPCDRAFAAIVRAYDIPKEIPLALIEGFEWDIAGRQYTTLDDLLEYAARVASSVGIMMTMLMLRRDYHVLSRAAELGLAMQLTNIARDIGEDARNGRVYIPTQWLEEAGLDREDFLKAPVHDERTQMLVKRLLTEADKYYEQAMTGVKGLPANCRLSILSAAEIYRAIGAAIAHNDHNAIDFRAHTSGIRKIGLSLSALLSIPFQKSINKAKPHQSIAFLVELATRDREPESDKAVDRFVSILAGHQQRTIELTRRAKMVSRPQLKAGT